MAYNHRGAYGHSLSAAEDSEPAVTTNAQDRQSHVHSLAEGCQAGFKQAGSSTQLQVDLKTPQVRLHCSTCPACNDFSLSADHVAWDRGALLPAEAIIGCPVLAHVCDGYCTLNSTACVQLVLAAEVIPMASGLLCAMCLMDGRCFTNKGKLQVHSLKPLNAST